MTHWRSERPAPSSVWMSASATFTIVMSRRRMKTPRHTATSVHHLGSRPSAVDGSVGAVVRSVIARSFSVVRPPPNHQPPNDYLLYDTPGLEYVKCLMISLGRDHGGGRSRSRTDPAPRARGPPRTPDLALLGPRHGGAGGVAASGRRHPRLRRTARAGSRPVPVAAVARGR